MCSRARSGASSPSNTAPAAAIAGTDVTPDAPASAVARSSCSRIPRRFAAAQHSGGVHLAGRGGDQHVVGILQECPPANAWRKAAWANGTVRPIDFA